MSLTDDDLEAAIRFPALAAAMVETVKRCHQPMGQFARLEAERFRQQERANKEALACANAEERVVELTKLLRKARDSVEYEAQDLHESYGERLVHKQEPVQELLKSIDAALAKVAK